MNVKLFKRRILSKISKHFNDRQALILIGARQVGKTSLLSLIKDKIEKNNKKTSFLFLNAENSEDLLHLENFSTFKQYLKANNAHNKKVVIFIDEFQRMNHPTKLLKLIYDEFPDIKLICTGSSSLDIYSRLSEESLSGRKHLINIYSLAFSEFLNFRYPGISPLFKTIANDKSLNNLLPEINQAWNDYIIWGGYPRIAITEDTEARHEELKEIYNSYLQKDVAGILNKDEKITFIKLVIILSSQNGQMLNINELSNTLTVSRSTIERFLFILEETFIIKILRPFSRNKRKEITKTPKFYFLDTGLRNSIKNDFSNIELRADNGELAENYVFTELLKTAKAWHEFYFWRTPHGAETDFIIRFNNLLFPIEVKFKNLKKAIVPTGLKAFINNYHPEQAFVLTKNFSESTKYNNTKVIFLPIPLASKIFSYIKPIT